MYGLSRICNTLRVLFKAYYIEYKYPQFRTCLDYMFHKYFAPKLNNILAQGFSAEIIAFRTFIESLVGKMTISSTGEGMGRSLELDIGTGETFEVMETILRSTGLSH